MFFARFKSLGTQEKCTGVLPAEKFRTKEVKENMKLLSYCALI